MADLIRNLDLLQLENTINDVLPTEILFKILKKLDYQDLQNAKRTCQKWNEIASEVFLHPRYQSKY